MTQHILHQPSRPADRLSWLWLGVGAVLLPFVGMQTILPPATWIAPLLMLRFARTQRAWVALPALLVVQYVTTLVAFRNIFPAPMVYGFALAGLVGVIPFMVDKVVASRLSGLARTLVFPIVTTVIEWLLGLSSLGTSAATAYSQSANLPLIQLASLVGIWGISFLLAWFAAIANEVWERAAHGRVAWREIGVFGGVLVAVLLYGSARIAFAPAQELAERSSTRVALLASDASLRHDPSLSMMEVAAGSLSLREEARAQYAPVLDDLMTRSRHAADAGAEFVVWAEGAASVLKEDEAALFERGRELAREKGIYLQMAIVTVLQTNAHPYGENRAVMFDPSGALVWDYYKTVHPFEDNDFFAPGDGIIPFVDTPFGRVATVICFDADFPALLRQVGQAEVDILLVPSNDWQPVHVLHAQVHRLRAVEYGVSLVRPTGNGITLVIDPLGRVLAEADYFRTDKLTLISDVPTRGMTTLYTRIGDLFIYLNIAALAGLVGAALLRRGERVTVSDPSPIPA